mmetsp:Transcript_1554/g.3417  ORF Transcript_1554/g.3417 Transcript_1554/m.3417 type:complete len:387 (-) Transcript_1554:90-1250(-)
MPWLPLTRLVVFFLVLGGLARQGHAEGVAGSDGRSMPPMPTSLRDMKVYVISLEERPERREHTDELLARLGVPEEHVEYVNPVPAEGACERESWLDQAAAGLTEGKCSLMLTMTGIFERAAEEYPDGYFAILEDDLKETKAYGGLDDMLEAFSTAGPGGEGPPTFHALHLQPCSDWCVTKAVSRAVAGEELIYRSTMSRCLGAVVFSSTTATEMVPLMSAAWNPETDRSKATSVAALFAETPGVLSYALPSPTFYQDPAFGTDLPHKSAMSRWVNQELVPQHECHDVYYPVVFGTMLLFGAATVATVAGIWWAGVTVSTGLWPCMNGRAGRFSKLHPTGTQDSTYKSPHTNSANSQQKKEEQNPLISSYGRQGRIRTCSKGNGSFK